MTGSRPITTTDAGIPAPSDHDSQSIGPNGPLLLQDHYLIQKMAQFNFTDAEAAEQTSPNRWATPWPEASE
jgi:catalase